VIPTCLGVSKHRQKEFVCLVDKSSLFVQGTTPPSFSAQDVMNWATSTLLPSVGLPRTPFDATSVGAHIIPAPMTSSAPRPIKLGKCNCVPCCLLCKGSGHHAHDKKCLLCRDLVPLQLPKAAPVEAQPLVEDARCVVLLAVSHPKQWPASKGKGKDKAKADMEMNIAQSIEEVGKEMPAEICHNTGDFKLVCFCCPMPPLEEFQSVICICQAHL
jgi:hypothetical protein